MGVETREHSDLSEQLLEPPDSVLGLAEAGMAIAALADLELASSQRRAAERTLRSAAIGLSADDWHDGIRILAEDIAEPWRDVALLFVAVNSPYVDIETLTNGAVHRRVDALFDVLETDYCAWEVQTTFQATVELLRQAQNSTSTSMGLKAAGIAGSFAGGWFGVGAGPALKAQEWLSDQVAQRSPLVYDLATVVAAVSLLDQDDETRPHLDVVRDRCEEHLEETAKALGSARSGKGRLSVGEATRQWNLWRNVLQVFEHDAASADTRTVPDLVGQALSTARHLADSKGFGLNLTDAGRPEADERMPLRESGWRVIAQHPPAGEDASVGSPLSVAVAKFAEQVSTQKARARARALHREVLQEETLD